MKKNRDFVFVFVFLFFMGLIVGFNFFIDPYYIFRDKTYKGINNVKLHKYTNKRTMLYSDIKINKYGKTKAFTGNCLLSNYGSPNEDVVFFTIPQAKVKEVSQIIENIMLIAPNIKTIYWGLFLDDIWNDFNINEEVTDELPVLDKKYITANDIINLFFSWNTTKYSIETLYTSMKNKGVDVVYLYPYREISGKNYGSKDFSFDSINLIKEVINKAKEKDINIIFYYSPIHVSKKIHMYENGVWDLNLQFKQILASITPFIDYSLFNEYNSSPIDKNHTNYIDNIHPNSHYNNLIVNDILSDTKKIGKIVNKDNVEQVISDDYNRLKEYIKNNQEYADKIHNISKEDAKIKILLD